MEKLINKIVGKRKIPTLALCIDIPSELGFRCPICKNHPYNSKTGDFDERLKWSEFNNFLWCEKCQKDIPSCFCVDFETELFDYVTDKSSIDYAIELFLLSIQQIADAQSSQK